VSRALLNASGGYGADLVRKLGRRLRRLKSSKTGF
jgi:hypothetical protein